MEAEIDWIVALALVLMAIVAALWFRISVRARREIRRILTRGVGGGPTFSAIVEALNAINAACQDYTFNVKRSATVLFRGQRITVVLGEVS